MSLLKIENAGLDDLLLASFHVNAGQSLGILTDGVASKLNVSDGILSGTGTLLNPIVVGMGGALSPGESPGTLTFADSLTLGSASYDWEIADPRGFPGSGWDLMQISHELGFTATKSEKLIVRVSGLDTIPTADFPNPNLNEPQRWIIASAGTISGFDPAAVAIEVVPSPNALRTLRPQSFSLSTEGGNLYLQFQVPEPGWTVWTSILGFYTSARLRRRSRGV